MRIDSRVFRRLVLLFFYTISIIVLLFLVVVLLATSFYSTNILFAGIVLIVHLGVAIMINKHCSVRVIGNQLIIRGILWGKPIHIKKSECRLTQVNALKFLILPLCYSYKLEYSINGKQQKRFIVSGMNLLKEGAFRKSLTQDEKSASQTT